MRLIDADALVWVLKHSKTYHKVIALDVVLDAVRCSPTIDAVEVVHGEWKEREVIDPIGKIMPIEQWQSARCSLCGTYHTTPYMYYFDEFNFCPNCGAKMKGADDEVR